MRHVTGSFAAVLAGALVAAGCATTHLTGEYNPGSNVPLDKGHEIQTPSEKQTLATGHDWVLFWGLVELQSTDMAAKVKSTLRPDELLTDVEVRNHISVPGALLWVVTAGIVSHHDVDLRGRVAIAKEKEPIPTPTVSDRGMGEEARRAPGESELFAQNRIDRPLGEIARDFDDAAIRAGLIPVAKIRWDEIDTTGRGAEYRGEVPPSKLEGVPFSSIQSFGITTSGLAKDVKYEPPCGTVLPCVVCYEKDGRTNVIYSRMVPRLRYLEASGQVGEGKLLTRSKYDDHMKLAQEFERDCEKLVENLKTAPRSP